MMPEILLYISCGLSAGLLGGYLGLGGGIIMVPFLTVVTGLDIKAAVPVSVAAIVVNSLASSNEYLKKGMVDLELMILLATFTIIGNAGGSMLSGYISADAISYVLTVFVLYAAISLLKGRKEKPRLSFSDNRKKYLFVCILISLLTGIIAALIGVGGGVILVPTLYLIIGVPLSTARGTSSMLIGFSSAAAAAVYLLSGSIDYEIASAVIVGIIIGGKIGGRLGALAQPKAVKIVFTLVMFYLAYKLSLEKLLGSL